MKNAKKVLAIVLALAMVMALGISAFAASDYPNSTITINGKEPFTVNVVEMYKIRQNGSTDKDEIGIVDGNDIVAYDFINTFDGFEDRQDDLAKTADFNEEASAYANAAAAFVEQNKNSRDFKIKTYTATTTDDVNYTVVTDTLEPGYYLVYEEGATSGAILVNVPSAYAANINRKTVFDYPEVEKTILNKDDPSAITETSGETLEFQLKSTVPDMSKYTEDDQYYKFWFVDTLTGLALDQESIVVTIGGELKTKDTDYTLDFTKLENDGEWYVKFDHLNKMGLTEGQEIIVTYSATITADAIDDDSAVNDANNSAIVKYSNNPDQAGIVDDPAGFSDSDDTDAYSYNIKIDKFAMDGNDEVPVSGVKFELWNEGETDKLATKTTMADGKVVFTDLLPGTYHILETSAPSPYNKINDPIVVVITAEDPANPVFSFTLNGNTLPTSDTDPQTVRVENKTGSILPSTGGIGTIIITVVGVAAVIGGFVLLRKKDDEDTAVKA